MIRTALLVPTLLGSLLLAPSVLAQKGSPADLQHAAFLAGTPWQQFLRDQGGTWEVRWCPATGTPSAVFGSGLPLPGWRGNSLEEARRQAVQLLRDQSDLLGLGTSDFRESIGARMGRTWSFKFDQWFAGLPVIGGRADVRVHMVGRVPMFGSTAVPIPADFATTPTLKAAAAADASSRHLGVVEIVGNAAAPRLVIWADVHAATPQRPRLCWEVRVDTWPSLPNGVTQRCYVDAHTGDVVHCQDDKHHCGPECGHVPPLPAAPSAPATDANAAAPAFALVMEPTTTPAGDASDRAPVPLPTTLTMRGWARTGMNATDPLTLQPMAGMQLDVPGVGLVTADDNGVLSFDIATTTQIDIVGIGGRHHRTIGGTLAPFGSLQVPPGGNFTVNLFDATATDGRCSHATASYWIDRTNRYARTILGNSPQLDVASRIAPVVNFNAACNAGYAVNTLVFYEAGGGCVNTAQPTVIVHEWGHGLDDQYGGVSTVGGLSEGWADVLANYLTDQPIIGGGFQGPGTDIRNAVNTLQYPNGTGVHEQGKSWMGFAWQLRERLRARFGTPTAIAVSQDIVIGSIVADATTQPDAVLQVFVADDDDGNLANGTPHAFELVQAAQQHSLPTPTAAPVANDECSAAYVLGDGLQGPFSNAAATTSAGPATCASIGKDVWFLYHAATAGTLTVSTCGQATFDTVVTIYAGDCGALTQLACNDDFCALQSTTTANVSPGPCWIRVAGYNSASGPFQLDVTGPGTGSADRRDFGLGCGGASRSFYELFPPGQFDLANTSFRLIRTPTGYLVVPGGSFVNPVLPLPLALTDESEQAVPLLASFPYPGGSTTTLHVCSNGYVSAASGNPITRLPSIGDWLDSPRARWGVWGDFVPSFGSVKYQIVASAYIFTWDNVVVGGGIGRFQLQFDTANGNITFVLQGMPSAEPFLVGFAAPGPNVNQGPRDLSTLPSATFLTGDAERGPLRLDANEPQFGGVVNWTTSQFAPTSTQGFLVLSHNRYETGLPLDWYGMPRCFQYVDLDVIVPMVPVAGQATLAMPIPPNPTLVGVQVSGQSGAFQPGVNAAGLVASNGVTITLGW